MKSFFLILTVLGSSNLGKDLKSKAQVHKDSIKDIMKVGTVKMGDYESKTRKLDQAIKGLKEVKGEAVAQKNPKYAKELNYTIETYQGVADKHKPSSSDKYGQGSSSYKRN